ncbi:CrcB family protein [Ignatzschineria rhizosphaerae]|uniref:Fluoride-specific ion channel FluC n=1 Tax=Ignatzschineria rhizosphaerae TaxID=2923279 RepID=A0ABY3X558_9GAMM|nr:CrcB family protein [Ignatzschineria rhizosphaerae]UNM96587.1 CrcB family protein [Ignatzschineria rhizosphaerae]
MPQLLHNLFLVMLGAAFGGGTRYLFTLLENKIDTPIQISTLIVNVGGGLLVGLIAGYLLQKPDQGIRLFLIVGFCGGLTTFSSFSLETMTLLQNREYLNSLLLILSHFLGAVGATFLGFYLIHKIMGH